MNDVSIVSPEEHASSEGTAAGAGIGAAVGGVGGLLAGLGTFAIPGIGPVVGAGWLVTTLIGAAAGGAAGGILGSLTEAGIDEDEAHVYAESIKRGGTLVTARVDETEAEAAEAILNQYGPVDIGSRRAEFEAGGWSGFDDEYDNSSKVTKIAICAIQSSPPIFLAKPKSPGACRPRAGRLVRNQPLMAML